MQPATDVQVPATSPGWAAAASPRLRRYLRCLRCPRDVADDLAQEALLAAVRCWRQQEPPLPWLLVTARNLWFEFCRRKRRLLPPQRLQQLHELALCELGDDGGDARVQALRQCVAALPPRSRLALQLFYRDGLSRREAAARLGLGDEGMKSLLERVKAALKKCVQERRQGDA